MNLLRKLRIINDLSFESEEFGDVQKILTNVRAHLFNKEFLQIG